MRTAITLSLLLGLWMFQPALSDTLTFKDGRQITGRYEGGTGRVIRFHTGELIEEFDVLELAGLRIDSNAAGGSAHIDNRNVDAGRFVVNEDLEVRGRSNGPLRIPPGHLPPPGSCRLWYPGRPPGHQPPPVRCSQLGRIPAGAWVVSRPDDVQFVRVAEYDPGRTGVVVTIRIYEAATGRFVRAERP